MHKISDSSCDTLRCSRRMLQVLVPSYPLPFSVLAQQVHSKVLSHFSMNVSGVINLLMAVQFASSCSTAQYKQFIRFFGSSFEKLVYYSYCCCSVRCWVQAACFGSLSHIHSSKLAATSFLQNNICLCLCLKVLLNCSAKIRPYQQR